MDKAMTIDENHWLTTAKREPIPGGAPMPVRRFLIQHFTAGASAMSSINWWRQRNNGVCAHFVIGRDGTIYQCRPCNRTAGHAGSSKWKDPKTGTMYYALNSCSIGIELANGGDSFPTKFSTLEPFVDRHGRKWETYPIPQMKACIELSKALVARYRLDDLIGHEHVSPGRKTDPGPAFPMAEVRLSCGFPAKIA